MPANRRVGRESRVARETSEDDSGDGVKGEDDDKRSRKGPAEERLSRAVDALSEETLKDGKRFLWPHAWQLTNMCF